MARRQRPSGENLPPFFSLHNLRLFEFLFSQSPLSLFFVCFSLVFFLHYASLAALRVIPPALKFLVLPPRWGGLRAISGPTPASRLNVELASESLSSSTTTFFFALLLLFSTTRLGAVFFTVLGAGRGGRRDLMVTPRLSFVVIRSSWNEEGKDLELQISNWIGRCPPPSPSPRPAFACLARGDDNIQRSFDPMEPHPVACSHDLRLTGPLLGWNMGQGIFSTASHSTWSLFNSFCESSDFLNRFTQLLWG